jgi:hypothetical protein
VLVAGSLPVSVCLPAANAANAAVTSSIATYAFAIATVVICATFAISSRSSLPTRQIVFAFV